MKKIIITFNNVGFSKLSQFCKKINKKTFYLFQRGKKCKDQHLFNLRKVMKMATVPHSKEKTFLNQKCRKSAQNQVTLRNDAL